MLLNEQLAVSAKPRLSVRVASEAQDIRRAQKLRFEVFAGEMGAELGSRDLGIDCDEYDALCDHLIVEDAVSGLVVGTYRMLSPAMARRAPSLYSEHEFDLTRLAHLRAGLIEVGRSCVHRDFRSGAVIALLWSGLADYVQQHGGQYLAGCASVSLSDGGHQAVSLYRQLEGKHLSPAEWRVFPHLPLPLDRVCDDAPSAPMPALIKGYLRAGAYICGEPAWDPDFNCADFFMLLPMSRLNGRYNKYFVG
ncbi:putative hemolysin [Chromobacterium alkanivorans]|uniref:GNAT family N-acetyltransferase n=1 Tax=Chromobacterium alkanivorans TaxID=1071719 RepID=UPI002167D430|nr:GNAT family N-acyltransferase [Chromobacterium alkanivorans]MCS3803452.1 putative hemolysin [Chromobacterium alkanivorans]MCS3817438.1 putative hemolysin [Chromobacterium alkanivorans]MCS3872818.1 putative hemolysin [Chromobacterium alkanivorans]